jgi:hypothetical protein
MRWVATGTVTVFPGKFFTVVFARFESEKAFICTNSSVQNKVTVKSFLSGEDAWRIS